MALPAPRTIALSVGSIEVFDVGPRDARPLIFVHGALASPTLWAPVIDRLSARYRCIAPSLPLGSHRVALNADADLSPTGVADLIFELATKLGLDRVTLVGNDSGGAISQIATARHPDRVEALVLTNCDALEVFPPKAYLYFMWLSARPALSAIFATAFVRFPRLGLMPNAYGSLSRTLGTEQIREWVKPLASNAGVRRDFAKFARGASNRLTIDAAEKLRSFERPVRFVWGTRDPHFKLALAKRLASMMRDARIHEIDGGRTYAVLDDPERAAVAIESALTEEKPHGSRSMHA